MPTEDDIILPIAGDDDDDDEDAAGAAVEDDDGKKTLLSSLAESLKKYGLGVLQALRAIKWPMNSTRNNVRPRR